MQTEAQVSDNRLSVLLRNSTAKAHSSAEGSSFIKNLFQGNVSPEEYYQYLWALHQMYEALESVMNLNENHEGLKNIYFRELERVPSLEKDLAVWSSARNEIPAALDAAVNEYRQYLFELAANSPIRLAAHAYVRYLGDLSGGQMLRKVLLKRYPNSSGLNFYEFEIANVAEMKTKYRRGLDQIGEMNPNEIDAICEEANLAFEFNGKIFKAMDAVPAGALAWSN